MLVDLLQQRLPTLHAHLDATGVLPMLPLITTQWFLALFVHWLPSTTLLRVWDCFFHEALLLRRDHVHVHVHVHVHSMCTRPMCMQPMCMQPIVQPIGHGVRIPTCIPRDELCTLQGGSAHIYIR